MTTLDELEQRVGERFARAAAARTQIPTASASFDVASWFDGLADTGEVALPEDWPQFPREQWVSYPNKRTAVLLLADNLMNHDLTDEQWSTLCLLMYYGGKTRLT
jgi:hypothetical protein